MQDAFEVLRRFSSQANVKLRDIAQVVVDAGGLPPTCTTSHACGPRRPPPRTPGAPGEAESPTG